MSVTDVDISAHALEAAKRNFLHNSATTGKCQHELIKADAFDWLAQSRTQFGLVVLDPPSFAKRESDRKSGIDAYARLAGMGIDRVEPGGILVAASCSAHVAADEFYGLVRSAGRKSGRRFAELGVTGHPADHPAAFPEAALLFRQRCANASIR